MLSACYVLIVTHACCASWQTRSELAEKTRAELAMYVKAKTDEILALNNVVARLKKEVEGYEAEAQVQESKKDASRAVASHKTLEFGQVSYNMICQTGWVLNGLCKLLAGSHVWQCINILKTASPLSSFGRWCYPRTTSSTAADHGPQLATPQSPTRYSSWTLSATLCRTLRPRCVLGSRNRPRRDSGRGTETQGEGRKLQVAITEDKEVPQLVALGTLKGTQLGLEVPSRLWLRGMAVCGRPLLAEATHDTVWKLRVQWHAYHARHAPWPSPFACKDDEPHVGSAAPPGFRRDTGARAAHSRYHAHMPIDLCATQSRVRRQWSRYKKADSVHNQMNGIQ
jgi:hypothetical protein